MISGLGVGELSILVIVGIPYVIPSFIAYKRQHPNKTAIILLNLLAGWTILGWFAALIWAFVGNKVDPSDKKEIIKKPSLENRFLPVKTCPHCGKEIIADMVYCGYCNKEV